MHDNKPFLEREKVTEIFKAGEHVKIVRTDDGYNDGLGDQTGLVGTVSQGGTSVYVTFPHTGDKEFYYLAIEIVRAPGTTPLPEPLKVGDWVKVEGYTADWDGTVGQVDNISPNGTNADIMKEGNKFCLTFPTANLELTEEPVPKAKFAVGDWVEVTGYAAVWNGAKGQITTVSGYNSERNHPYVYVIETHDFNYASTGGFGEKYLKATEEPYIPKFKVGDWVQSNGCCSSSFCEGATWQITRVPDTAVSGYYTGQNGSETQGYNERYLTAAEAPHWTATKPVGATAQSKYSDGTHNRILTKTGENQWMHIYQNSDGSAYTTSLRSNERTKSLYATASDLTWLGAERT